MTSLSGGFALIILAATLLAFLARKTEQPTVIAYIVAGLVLGPVGFNAVAETELTSLLSELGLVFLLFLIGIEIDLEEVKEIMGSTALIGLIQMGLSATAGTLIGLLLGFSQFEALFIGAATMFSSTALVVKMLSEKEGSSLAKRIDIGVLLVQDVAVIVLLAIISAGSTGSLGLKLAEIILLIIFIAAISLFSSKYFLPKLFREIADNQHAFFIHGVAWAFILITVSAEVGLSMEIGAFFAGLSLAQLPYSRELQERVRPLTDLFMAIFFVNFGLGIETGQLTAFLGEAVIASLLIMISKFGILFFAVDRFNYSRETSFKSSLNMVQISEFSLVLTALAAGNGLVSPGIAGFISLVAIMTMGTSSYLISYNHRIYSFLAERISWLESDQEEEKGDGKLSGHAVVIGYDEIARHALPVLEDQFEDIVVIDRNPANIDELSSRDLHFYHGNFQHSEIKKSANIGDADLVLSVAPDLEVNKDILEHVTEQTTTFVKADSREEAGELYEMGAHYVIVRNILTGEKMSEYIELYFEDRELFEDEISSDKQKINYGGEKDV